MFEHRAFEPAIPTHDSHVSHNFLRTLGGHPESLKLLRLQHNVDLKRLASGVQLPPWPPNPFHPKIYISLLNHHIWQHFGRSIIFDIHKRLRVLGLHIARAQPTRAWRLPISPTQGCEDSFAIDAGMSCSWESQVFRCRKTAVYVMHGFLPLNAPFSRTNAMLTYG